MLRAILPVVLSDSQQDAVSAMPAIQMMGVSSLLERNLRGSE